MTIEEMTQPVIETLKKLKNVDIPNYFPDDHAIKCRVTNTESLHQIMNAFTSGSCKWTIDLWGSDVKNWIWMVLNVPRMNKTDLKNELDYKVCMLKQELGV